MFSGGIERVVLNGLGIIHLLRWQILRKINISYPLIRTSALLV